MLTRILFTDDVEPATSNRKLNTAHARYIVGSSLRLRFRINKNLKFADPPPSRSAHGPLANDFLSMNSLLYNWCNIYLRYIISVIHVEASTRNVLWFIHSLITKKSVRVGVLGLSNFIYAKKVNIQSLCSTHMHVYIRCIITCIYREGKYIIEFFLKKFRGLWVVKPCPSPLACFRRHTWRTIDVRVGSLSLRFSQFIV